MHRIITILILLTAISFSGLTQEKRGEFCKRREMFETQKVSYITQKMQLTIEEAQNFWPLFNEMQRKKNELLTKKQKLMHRVLHNYTTMDNNEISNISDQIIDLQVNLAQLQKRYHLQFKKVLPALKVLQLYQAEKQFKEMLLRRIRNNPYCREKRGE